MNIFAGYSNHPSLWIASMLSWFLPFNQTHTQKHLTMTPLVSLKNIKWNTTLAIIASTDIRWLALSTYFIQSYPTWKVLGQIVTGEENQVYT